MKSGMHSRLNFDQTGRCRNTLRLVTIIFGLSALAGLTACEQSANRQQFNQLSELPLPLSSLKRESTLNQEPVRALEPVRLTAAQTLTASLGEKLFHDTRLSGDSSVSCASCHDIQNGGDDGRPTSIGVRGQIGPINSPTVLNSGHSFRQFWDGRVNSLAQQVLGPVTNPLEMDAKWPVVIAQLSGDSELVAMFDAAFGQKEITPHRVALAIASFERSLVTPSPFDSYLKGDNTAITPEAESGYRLFKEYGCVACHQGVNLGGNLMQYFGAFHSIDLNDNLKTANLARNAMPMYKVPTLRNVALTGPYFHTGSVTELSDAVRVMGSVQLGRLLSPEDVQLLVAFLESLTGEVPVSAQPAARKTVLERASR